MPRKAGEKPRRRSAPSALLDVKVLDPKRLELQRLIEERRRLTRKIRKLPLLQQRLAIEEPELSLERLLARLQQKKTAADKAIAKHDGLPRGKAEARQPPRSQPRSMIIERAQPANAEMLATKQYTGHHGWRDHLQRSVLDLSHLFQLACPTINGTAAPYLTRTGATVAGLNSINHDSTAGYLFDQQSYLMGELGYLVAAWLNDDASIWRDDNPDRVMWYDNVCMSLPVAECDSAIVASLLMRFSGEILSEADDHNEIRQYVYVAHSDEAGDLPPYVSFGQEFRLNDLDLSGEIGLPSGNQFDSGWVSATMYFGARAGAIPKVAVANCTELLAQDGVLEIVGTWRVTDLVYSLTPV